jgi:transcription initiation factor IIE alpha subunit
VTQQSYFDFAPVVRDTRSEALAAIEPMKPNMLHQVFDFIVRRGDRGATDEEIAIELKMRESTARARRVELRDGGQVRDSHNRRSSRAGRLCVVWKFTGKTLEG